MYLAEFLENPVGKGDASIPNKSLILGALSAKYDRYTDRSTGKHKVIEMKVYRNAGSDTYYFWLTMPTETERDNTYDVVFKFHDPEKKHRRDLSIYKYDFQVFANTPSFAYTYAYVYNKNGLMIPKLTSKLGRKIISSSPDVRNRNQNIMYDKYIYFAARYILESKKMNRVTLEMIAKPFDEKYLISHIRTLDEIMDQYRKAEEKLKKKKKSSKVHKETPKHRTTMRVDKDEETGVNIKKAQPKIHSSIEKAAHTANVIKKKRGTIRKK